MNSKVLQQPLAHIDPRAKIGKNVTIEPFATIYGDVEIGDGTWIGPNVVLFDGARIGKDCRIFPGAVISAIPQDLKFNGEYTTAEIGDRTTIRECATINRGTVYHNRTVVGSDTLIMAYAHVAHDCILGDHVVVANSVNMGGHVEIGDWAIIGGMCAIHQFVRVGTHSIIQGGSMIGKDIPPYITTAREHLRYSGVNTIGLKRREFTRDQIEEIRSLYRVIFQSGYNVSQALEVLDRDFPASEYRDTILDFIRNSDRGIIRGTVNSSKDEPA